MATMGPNPNDPGFLGYIAAADISSSSKASSYETCFEVLREHFSTSSSVFGCCPRPYTDCAFATGCRDNKIQYAKFSDYSCATTVEQYCTAQRLVMSDKTLTRYGCGYPSLSIATLYRASEDAATATPGSDNASKMTSTTSGTTASSGSTALSGARNTGGSVSPAETSSVNGLVSAADSPGAHGTTASGSKAWVAGAVLGPVVGIVLPGLVFFYFYLRRRRRATGSTKTGDGDEAAESNSVAMDQAAAAADKEEDEKNEAAYACSSAHELEGDKMAHELEGEGDLKAELPGSTRGPVFELEGAEIRKERPADVLQLAHGEKFELSADHSQHMEDQAQPASTGVAGSGKGPEAG